MPSLEEQGAAITIVQDLEGNLEFHASYVNDHGTGHTTIVSNPENGMVDIVMTQLIAHEAAECAMVSLSLPTEAVAALMRALNGGLSIALQQARFSKYN
jgi:hypothetical protein